MKRLLLVSCSAAGLLAPISADALELPVRKAGLWEMTVQDATGAPKPEMTMQQCTDETTDKDMSTSFSPMAKESARSRTCRRPRPAMSAIPSAASPA